MKACLADQLIKKAMALNEQAAFLAPSQPVEVKLEAYPSTRYGIAPGGSMAVFQDAILRGRRVNFPDPGATGARSYYG